MINFIKRQLKKAKDMYVDSPEQTILLGITVLCVIGAVVVNDTKSSILCGGLAVVAGFVSYLYQHKYIRGKNS